MPFRRPHASKKPGGAAPPGFAAVRGTVRPNQLLCSEHPDGAALLEIVHPLGDVATPQRHRATPAGHHRDVLLAVDIPQVTGGAITPEPVWNFHASSPVLALTALMKPSGVP